MTKYVIFMSRSGGGGGGWQLPTSEKMKKTIFNCRDEEKKIAIRMEKLGVPFLKWEQLSIN